MINGVNSVHISMIIDERSETMRRLNLELSEEAYQNLEKLRKQMSKPSKAEVIRSGVAVLDLIQLQKSKGKSIGIIGEDGQASTRIEII